MKILKDLDYLGTKPTLYIKGDKSYKTYLGGSLSLMFVLCLIAGTSYFVHLLISGRTYTIETSEEFTTNSYADWNNMEVTINLLDKLGMSFSEPDRLFGVTSMWWKLIEETKPDGSVGIEIKMIPIALEKCNITKHFSDPSLIPQFKWVTSSYCMKPNQNFNLTRPYGYPNNTSILFWIHRCKNTTLKTDCYPSEKIEKDLMNTNVALTFKNYYYDHKKTKNIGIPYLFSDAPIASSTNYRRIRYTLNEVQYTVDNGMLFPSEETTNYVTFSSFRETVDFRTDPVVTGALVGISFNMNDLKQKIRKNYYKFQNMLADLGGLYKAVLTIITFINGYFSDRFYFNEIIERNINSMSENSNNKSNIIHKPDFITGTSLVNLGQSQNKLLNLNNLNKDNQIFIARGNSENNSDDINNKEPIKNHFSLNKINHPKNDNFEKIEKKYSIKNLKFLQNTTPLSCNKIKSSSSQKFKMHNKFKNFVINQLDIVNLIIKINNLDKICNIVAGSEYKNFLHDCINPDFFDKSDVSVMYDFNEIKRQILHNISNCILNHIVEDNK
jgi:hypothetical protein